MSWNRSTATTTTSSSRSIGPLTDESWVIDFSLLKRLTREVCETLDHKFLLQMDSRALTITDDDTHYLIQYQ